MQVSSQSVLSLRNMLVLLSLVAPLVTVSQAKNSNAVKHHTCIILTQCEP